MQRATRSNTDNTLVHVKDPEQLIRVRRRSMAEQAEQEVVNKNLRITRDSDGEEYSEAEEMNVPDLYVPDLNNTPLQRAIQNGMALNDTKPSTEYGAPSSRSTSEKTHSQCTSQKDDWRYPRSHQSTSWQTVLPPHLTNPGC